jgi:hypothetical protein
MLTAEELCDICGTTVAQRQAWAKDGDLRQQRGFEELDAVELALYASLRRAAGPRRAKAAWRDARDQVQDLLLRPPRRLWIVIEVRGVEEHGLASRPAELYRRLEHGRPVIVLNLRQVIDKARTGYRAAASRKRPGDIDSVRVIRPAG